MKTAAILFALAAMGGLTLAVLRLGVMDIPPTWMAIAHGIVASLALIALVAAAARDGLPAFGKAALGVFVLAAAGGLYIFVNYHLAGQALPVPLVLVHGAAAVTAFGLLLAAIFAPRAQRHV
jgi:hypothetical protein